MLRFDTDKCNCWDGTIGRYLGALVKVDAFPVEDAVNRSSIREILDRLRKFKVDRPSRSCNRCQLVDWVSHVIISYVSTNTNNRSWAWFMRLLRRPKSTTMGSVSIA
jgi:hypothetical protein